MPRQAAPTIARVRPLGPESCLFELWSMTFYPEGEEPEPPLEPTMLPYDSEQFPPIPRQDYANIPIQQVGLRSDDFEFMRLARREEGLISNYQRLIDGYLAGIAPQKLAAANQKLGGNFDGEILDLGVKAGLVEKSGSWFSYDSIRIGQGRENAKEYLKTNPEVCDRLEAAIRGRTDEVAGEMMTGPDAEDLED